MDEHAFCRANLAGTMENVRKNTTTKQRKTTWAYKYDPGQMVEFHGPDNFYWYGRGCCRWDARAKGWGAWLESRG